MSKEDRKRERARRRRQTKQTAAAPVGYGRPPKHTQFQPGKSGNPSGRPKGNKEMNDILERSLMAPVEVTLGGKRKKVPALEAILLRERNKALQGDIKSARFLFDLFESRGLGGAAKSAQSDLQQSFADARERLREKLEAAVEAEEG